MPPAYHCFPGSFLKSIMSTLKSPVFIICCLLFIGHQILQKGFGVSLPVFDQYLDSLLAMPIILTLLLWERRVLFKKGNNYRLSILEVVVATVFIALVSEVFFPMLSTKFTSDWWDLVFYTIGSIIFLLTINNRQAQ